MDLDLVNKKYWSHVPPEEIMSGVHYPGKELFDVIEQGSNILDIGCGNGKVSSFLYEAGHKVTGVDINKNAIEKNKQENPAINYYYADITEKIPFPDNTFDVITISYVFVSIVDVDLVRYAVSEIRRVLKKGGYIWLCEAIYSNEYMERYVDGKNKTGLNNIALSYKKDSSGMATGEVKRVIKHYSENELDILFGDLTKVSSDKIVEKSPSSGMEFQTIVLVYKS